MRISIFTRRENDVLAAMVASAIEHGNTHQTTIARRLFVTERTVQTHFGNMFKKAQVGDKASLALWAVRQGEQ